MSKRVKEFICKTENRNLIIDLKCFSHFYSENNKILEEFFFLKLTKKKNFWANRVFVIVYVKFGETYEQQYILA